MCVSATVSSAACASITFCLRSRAWPRGRNRRGSSMAPGSRIGPSSSAAFDGALAIGFSTQWASPTPEQSFRYGGAVQPASLAHAAIEAMTETVQKLAAGLSLVGLNSAVFLVDESGVIQFLEINPRPGATL